MGIVHKGPDQEEETIPWAPEISCNPWDWVEAYRSAAPERVKMHASLVPPVT